MPETALRGRSGHRSGRRSALKALVALCAGSVALTATSLGLSATAASAASGANPLAALQSFTVVSQQQVVTDAAAGGHIEGSIAAGSDLVVNGAYALTSNHQGAYPLPSIGGAPTQLLTGGSLVLAGQGEVLDVDSGATRVGDPTGYGIDPAQPDRWTKADGSAFARLAGSTSTDAVAASGVFAQTFAGAFDQLRGTADGIAALSAANGVTLVTPEQPSNFNGIEQGAVGITLASGTNVLRIGAADLSAITKFKLQTQPDASHVLVVDVTGSGALDVRLPAMYNGDLEQASRYILYSFDGASALSVRLPDGQVGEGSILAPNADATLVSGYFGGQLAAKSVRVQTTGELHNIPFAGELPTLPTTPTDPPAPTPTPVGAPSPVVTAATCTAGGTISLAATTGVSYSWLAAPAGQTGAFDALALTGVAAGTYRYQPVAADGYQLTDASAVSVTIAPATGCVTADAQGSWRFVDTCCPTGNTLTLNAIQNATYTVAVNGAAAKTFSPGTYALTQGSTYVVTVVPNAGHSLAAGSATTETRRIGANCAPKPVAVHGTVTSTVKTCTAGTGNNIQLKAVTGVVYVVTVDGRSTTMSSGTVSAVAGKTYTVEAKATSGYVLDGAQSTWKLCFTEPNCGGSSCFSWCGIIVAAISWFLGSFRC